MKLSITSFAAVMVASTQVAAQWYGGATQRLGFNRTPYGAGALAPQRPQYNDYNPQFGQQRPQSQWQRPQFGQQRPQFGQQRPQFGQQRPQFGMQRPQFGQQRPQFNRDPYQQQSNPYNRLAPQAPQGSLGQYNDSNMNSLQQQSGRFATRSSPYRNGQQQVRGVSSVSRAAPQRTSPYPQRNVMQSQGPFGQPRGGFEQAGNGFEQPLNAFEQQEQEAPKEPETYYRSGRNTENIARPENPFARGVMGFDQGSFGPNAGFDESRNEEGYQFELPAFLRPDYKDPSEVAKEEAAAAAAAEAALQAPVVVEQQMVVEQPMSEITFGDVAVDAHVDAPVVDAVLEGDLLVDAEGETLAEGEEGVEGEEEDLSETLYVYVQGKGQELDFDELGYAWSEDGFLVNKMGQIQNRDPVTGQYMGRVARQTREEREKRIRANAYEGREARAAREAREARDARADYVPDRPEYEDGYVQEDVQENQQAATFWDQANQRATVDAATAMPTVMDDPWAKVDFDKYTAEPTYTENKFVQPEINYEPGFGNKFATTDVSDAAQADIEEAEAKAAEDAAAEGEEGEDGEEEPPKLEKEAYMTKDYYMPGYVDKTPAKEYPPHIQMFKNYISSIGDFNKHGYEAEDYSPDSSTFAPDTSGFGPDSDSFAPDTDGFGPKIARPRVGGMGKGLSGQSFRPEYDQFRPDSSAFGLPQGQQYRPDRASFGASNPGRGQFAPPQGQFAPPSGQFRPAIGQFGAPQGQSYGPPQGQTYGPGAVDYRTQFAKPQANYSVTSGGSSPYGGSTYGGRDSMPW